MTLSADRDASELPARIRSRSKIASKLDSYQSVMPWQWTGATTMGGSSCSSPISTAGVTVVVEKPYAAALLRCLQLLPFVRLMCGHHVEKSTARSTSRESRREKHWYAEDQLKHPQWPILRSGMKIALGHFRTRCRRGTASGSAWIPPN
jgi:hypothetical protein